jgi:hypothetical protein
MSGIDASSAGEGDPAGERSSDASGAPVDPALAAELESIRAIGENRTGETRSADTRTGENHSGETRR